MQERKKKKIVIASVLKPVDEPRMFGKIGTSLASQGHEVHVYGCANKAVPNNNAIVLHGHFIPKRLSLQRLYVPWILLRKWLFVKPEILIICSHELLLAAAIYKLLKPVKLIYDVQENYYLNILYTNAFPIIIRFTIAVYVRLKEKLVAPFIAHFFLAESVYVNQLAFVRSAYSIIPNTLPKPELTSTRHKGYGNWLFTGTLAASTGVYKVIDLIKALHLVDSTIRLTIAGFAPSTSEQLRILSACVDLDYITLKGIENPVPHIDVVKEVKRADIGFIYYPLAKHTAGRIPTKFYEYSSLKLPILTWKDQSIADMVTYFGLGWVLDGTENTKEILSQIQQQPKKKPLPPDHFWEFTDHQLFKIIDSL